MDVIHKKMHKSIASYSANAMPMPPDDITLEATTHFQAESSAADDENAYMAQVCTKVSSLTRPRDKSIIHSANFSTYPRH